MLEDYLIVHKSILPDCFDAVLAAKDLLEAGKAKNISEAVKLAGISRSTFYKYKDLILKPANNTGGKNAVLSMLVAHKTGELSNLLSTISASGASVLTITQSLPIRGKASVTISIDLSSMTGTISSLMNKLVQLDGIENTKLIAIE